MPVIISSIKLSVTADKSEALKKAKSICGNRNGEYHIYKISLDARKQSDMSFVYSVYCEFDDIGFEKRLCERNKNISFVEPVSINPNICKETADTSKRVVIAGFGPAGMFCALILAEYGYCPIVLERGMDVESRVNAVNTFWKSGLLDADTNVQFGEGGAGTFSDGKLTTRIKDPLCRYVLERLVQFGAPSEILTRAKAHIGTDKLREVVRHIRERITELGGEIRFCSKLDDIVISNGEIVSCKASGSEIDTSALVLAIGHSARDTFEMLCKKGIFIEPKPFSVGCRIEHRQEDVDKSLYGEFADKTVDKGGVLPVGEYQLSHRLDDGRAAYTFCMCPGGYVVPSSSEHGGIVTNGMSEFARDSGIANAAVVVSVSPSDYGNGVLDGVEFARSLEQRAYSMTGKAYAAPASDVGSFLRGEKPTGLDTSYVKSSYALDVEPADLSKLFPSVVTSTLQSGLAKFARQMKCFGNEKAILTAPETRTSSPVRITRGDELTSVSCKNLYPSGEGAGYAGGITSAAVDGIRCALKLMENYPPMKGKI